MRIPANRIASAVQMGAATKRESDTPVRVAVYIDATATPFLIDCIRNAFVPQTTAGLVRVERLGEARITPKPDTDVAIVLSCGSPRLETAVQEIIVAGAPVAVVAESSVEAPFIAGDTPMLGLIAATDKTHLLETLARWILDRTEKDTAFAANFPFMRIAAANRIIASCALTNMATGALVFMPGADFPVMTLAQVGMALKLASVYDRGIKPERGYEIAAILAGGALLRAASRAICKRTPHVGFIVKALIAGAGSWGMGHALCALYERDIDYAPLNDAIAAGLGRVRAAAGAAAETGQTA